MRITGYTFRADNYCPPCVATAIIEFIAEERGIEAPFSGGLNPWQVEKLLDTIAEVLGVDRENESSFDSDDFPKVVLSLDDDDVTCGQCGKNFS